MQNELSHLDWLEAEAIHIMREVAGQCSNPVLLFSGGKDSLCLLRIAEKAFRPGKFPFPLMHIDTGHNYQEVINFRDRKVTELNERLIVRSVEDSMARGTVKLNYELEPRNKYQSITLLEAIEEFEFDCCIGGARRDEEKARAKERIMSFRDSFGQWDPKNQRPELWNLFNGRKAHGEHFRVFPLSNWTEMDVWQYLKKEEIELPSLYFSPCIISPFSLSSPSFSFSSNVSCILFTRVTSYSSLGLKGLRLVDSIFLYSTFPYLPKQIRAFSTLHRENIVNANQLNGRPLKR